MLQVEVIATTPDKIIDMGSVCEEIKLNFELEGNCGSMETSYIPKHRVELSEGDCITVKVNGKRMFHGWVFKKEMSAYGSVKLKVYDIKRYLAGKGVDITANETVDQLFARLCGIMKIKHNVIHTSNFVIPGKIHDGETYNNIIQYAIDQTFIGTDGKERFCIRANGDTLELLDCFKQAQETDILIGDKNLMTDYQYSSDIENTYTVFKLQREVASQKDKKGKKQELSELQKILLRKTLTGVNQQNKDRWGSLMYYELKDAKWTDAQLEDYMKHIMVALGDKTRTLQLPCLGHTECIPGNGVILDIGDLVEEGVPKMKYALITAASHTIANNLHTMDLTVEVPQL